MVGANALRQGGKLMDGTGGLEFGAASAATVTVHSTGFVYGAVLASLVFMILLMAGTFWLARRDTKATVSIAHFDEWAPALRALAIGALISIVLVQIGGATTAYLQTQVANESTSAYFQYLSWPKLVGMSHAHVFGFFVIHSVLGILLIASRASETLKTALVSVVLWAGIFDVASWWGIKLVSVQFEILSCVCGGLTGLCTLTSVYLVARALVRKRP